PFSTPTRRSTTTGRPTSRPTVSTSCDRLASWPGGSRTSLRLPPASLPSYPRHMTTADEVLAAARGARSAAAQLAPMPRAAKDKALLAMADALEAHTDDVLAANAEDVARGREGGLTEALIDRLSLDPKRVRAMADGLRQV